MVPKLVFFNHWSFCNPILQTKLAFFYFIPIIVIGGTFSNDQKIRLFFFMSSLKIRRILLKHLQKSVNNVNNADGALLYKPFWK